MIYFSDKLTEGSKYNYAVHNLFAALANSHNEFLFIQNTRDIWMRDFMPVRTKSGRYVAFRYEPSYLSDGMIITLASSNDSSSLTSAAWSQNGFSENTRSLMIA